MDEQRRLGDKWREGDVEVARSLAVPVGQDKVPSLKCSVTSTPLQGSRQRPLSAPLRGSLHKAPGFAGGYLLRHHWHQLGRGSTVDGEDRLVCIHEPGAIEGIATFGAE